MSETDSETRSMFDWIDRQQPEMLDLLREWAEINSATKNLAGIERLAQQVTDRFSPLADTFESVPVRPEQTVDNQGNLTEAALGDTLVFQKRPNASRWAVLSIHLDTVYPADCEFQITSVDGERLRGPGVADAKGGLIVMLLGLSAYERFLSQTTATARGLGWKVILNADEEIGSPGSGAVFADHADGAAFGLIYEPCLPNGNLVSVRKGSGNFAVIVRGQSAHAGREFDRGRNAIVAAAEVARQLHSLNGRWPDTTLNVARIEGGGPNNVVPDVAVVHFNVRYPNANLEQQIEHEFSKIIRDPPTGISMERFGSFSATPKQMSDELLHLLEQIQGNAKQLDLDIKWEPTGGVCDGNRLAALGVPNVDTMGVHGGNIHSDQEFMWIPSLAERAKLTALTLISQTSL